MKLLLVAGLVSCFSLPNAGQAEVIPLENLPATPLAELVAAILPSDGFESLDWGYMADSPIISWQTPGIETTESGMTMRVGLARVTVDGVPSKVLLQRWKEIGWNITMSTNGNPNQGPQLIEIKPGGSTPDSICFGSTFSGCSFTSNQALRSPDLRWRLLCTSHMFGDTIKVYSVSAPGKKPSLVTYELSGGSGGESSSLEISPMSRRSIACNPK